MLELKVKSDFGNSSQITLMSYKKHILTHQIIHVRFFALKNYIFNFNKQKELNWVSFNELEELPKPNVIRNFIEEFSEAHEGLTNLR